jgi:crotonobetainyl-CoA:carnitine CoA-transferase CaiB-like acyl-CoA transferase
MYNFLQGMRVIEMGHILLGPHVGQALGDMGADIIKIEAPEGDFYRTVGVKRNKGMSAQWLNCNRNKRSISIDLKSQEGRDVLKELLRGADVFIHNMRPRALAKLGFDYESVKELNSSIVYCYSSGFGEAGPYRDFPAFDDIIQARSGLASLNGVLDGQPKLTPMAITDLATSMNLTQAVLAGVYRKATTGQGCCVEVPMFESFATLVMNQHLNGHAFQPPEDDVGYQRMLSPFRKPCATADGFIVHGVYTFAHWKKFLAEVGREDIIDSDLLADPDQMGSNIAKLYQIMAEEILPLRESAAWLQLFEELDIPCAPIVGIGELEDDPHLKAMGMFRDYDHPSEGKVRDIRHPFMVRGIEEEADVPPPVLGLGTRGILAELGYPEEKIDQLISSGFARDAN